jgi:hypothetical protein
MLYCIIVFVAPVDMKLPVADFFDVFACNEEVIFVVINDQYACEKT